MSLLYISLSRILEKKTGKTDTGLSFVANIVSSPDWKLVPHLQFLVQLEKTLF